MRIVMMGTGGFAVPTFKWLLDSGHDVLALWTRPPRPVHGRRGQKEATNPMREVADAHRLPVAAPEDVNSPEANDELRQLEPELLVVCDYGQILSSSTLTTSTLGGINLHASILPKYRGAAPINWALYRGETETGVTVIHMSPVLDGGPMIVQRTIAIGPQEDAVSLEGRLSEVGVQAVEEAIEKLRAWDGHSSLGRLQDPAQATRARRLRKQDGQIDWSRSASDIFNQIRAMKPWPGCFTEWKRGDRPVRLLIDAVRVGPAGADAIRPGTVLATDRESARVACGQGSIELLELHPAGKSNMSIAEFLRGYPLQVGDRLGD